MNDPDIGAKKHLLLTVARANQSTSIIRAIVFSANSHHVLFKHLYGILYVALSVDLEKLFDKKHLNLERLIDRYKTKMPHTEFEQAKKAIIEIKAKHKKTLASIESTRHSMGAHLNREEANRVYNDPFTDENVLEATAVQSLLADILKMLSTLSILDEEDRVMLNERVGPKDVLDILGLKMDDEVAREILNGITSDQ